MFKVPCFYHPESLAVGQCARCGQPICATCSTMTTSYFTRMPRRLCRACLALSEVKTMAIIIGTFVPFVLVASIGWAFFVISPIIGWLYLVAIPTISGIGAITFYRGRIRKIKASNV